ncbi:formylglycine-generating enzyme family protein [Ramlibacter rhizophilus]|uniref:Formylglycine-generating enzyme family protein n=1 Tax=Ramlibacter rhizophilus TaxID=1781167 RepID=A0A4Z0C2P2_9BURK|nr:SUMF1/EgtB/PvdO family nonheme iron enzyme [Ramlibacter rhizophilus]TFZ04485.1 formylglycine-generating enzyme family protein [Ramlibacter rhizophilus]
MHHRALLLCAFAISTAQAQVPPPAVTDSLGIEFAFIPPGSFTMGRTESIEELKRAFPAYDAARFEELGDEVPPRKVTLSTGFYLARHEVTVGQFRRFLESSGHVPESIADGTGGYGWRAGYDPKTSASGDAFEGRSPAYSWRAPGFAQTERHPVTNVTFNDAVAMARWLSRKEGVSYRLPTEAEWEYACLGGTGHRFGATSDPARLSGFANLFDASSARLWPHWQAFAQPGDDGHVFTAPVGSFAPNGWGLHDMNGNVWEWVSDYYADTWEGGEVDPKGPQQGHLHVRRGGSWHSWALYTRCAYRNWNTAQTRYVLVGFRLLREVK